MTPTRYRLEDGTTGIIYARGRGRMFTDIWWDRYNVGEREPADFNNIGFRIAISGATIYIARLDRGSAFGPTRWVIPNSLSDAAIIAMKAGLNGRLALMEDLAAVLARGVEVIEAERGLAKRRRAAVGVCDGWDSLPPFADADCWTPLEAK